MQGDFAKKKKCQALENREIKGDRKNAVVTNQRSIVTIDNACEGTLLPSESAERVFHDPCWRAERKERCRRSLSVEQL